VFKVLKQKIVKGKRMVKMQLVQRDKPSNSFCSLH
jgi:hypothetical protein